MSLPAVNSHRDLPPGVNFAPTDEQLVRIYLLPRVCGHTDPFPGLIIEDDTAANTQPWELFSRHGRPRDVPAFFYVRTNDAKAVPRPDRRCHGGGSWKSQKRVSEDASHELLVDGEKIKWSRHNLNLNMGSGSIGWVMHEYSITDCPSLKICRISFTGYCKKRKREPDGYDEDCLAAGESVPQRSRVTAANSSRSPSTFDQDFGTAHASQDQEPTQQYSSDEAMLVEMTNAPQPNLEFQEQGKTMEQLGTVQLPSAPQEPAQLVSAGQDPWMMLLYQELPSYDDIKEMFSSLPKTPADGHPYHYQQFYEQVPARAMEQKVDQGAVMMPTSFSGAQDNMDSMAAATQDDGVHWGGFHFC